MQYIIKRTLKAMNYSKTIFQTDCKDTAFKFLNRKENMWSWNDCTMFLKKYPELPKYELWLRG